MSGHFKQYKCPEKLCGRLFFCICKCQPQCLFVHFHCVEDANLSPKALRSRTHFSVHGRGCPQASTFCSIMKSFISPIGLLLLFSCIQHISCLHLDWSVFFLISICMLFLAPELYAPRPYSAFEIVPGPLYSSKLRAMAQLLIGKPIEKLPVEGQACVFLQALSPLPRCSPAPIWSQVADVFYLACFCTFSTL